MHAEVRGEYQQVFEEREIAHMVDVKKLFLGGFAIRNIAAMIGAALLIILFVAFREKMIKPVCVSYLWVTGAMLIIAAVLGVIMATNFDALFLKFHHVFFDNDLWLLDINTDVLIQMLPESFFNSLALAIVGYLAAFILVPAAGAGAYLIVNKKKNG
jgi:integral membrane protein (TIGR01906 family)